MCYLFKSLLTSIFQFQFHPTVMDMDLDTDGADIMDLDTMEDAVTT